tara:strand:+ start:4681 stop:5046 length:366 start_codon:yes stop_codon:yes gene_type:complete
MGTIKEKHPDYPGLTRYDKRARNMRYFNDIHFKKYHWNDLTIKERDYWRSLVQIEEEDAKEGIQGRYERDDRKRWSENFRTRRSFSSNQQEQRRRRFKNEASGYGHGSSSNRPIRNTSQNS